MNLTLTKFGDQTLGMAPIECGFDNPNCLGGYSTILNARDAALEPPNSRWFYDIAPALQTISPPNSIDNGASSPGACSCFTGTAVVGPDGSCGCVNSTRDANKKAGSTG